MSRKTLMYSIFAVNIIIFIVYGYLRFSSLTSDAIYDKKNIITIKKSDSMTDEKFVDVLCNTSEKLSADIALEYLSEDYTYTYYRTSVDQNFFKLNTEVGTSVTNEGTVFSSLPNGSEKKIYGFIRKSNEITISPIRNVLDEREVNLSVGRYLIDSHKVNDYINELQLSGIECETAIGLAVEMDFSSLYMLICMFVFFGAISVVFYTFSESRDIAVKKSMGYTNLKMCFDKFKRSCIVFGVELLVILLITFIVFSIIYDVTSTILFVKYLVPTVLTLCFVEIGVLVCCYIYVSTRCNVRHIKGMTRDRELFAVSMVAKTVILVAMVSSVSYLVTSVSDIYRVYNATKNTVELVQGYAATEINVRLEEPENYIDRYRQYFIDFYKLLDENNNVILANLEGIDEQIYEGENPYVYNSGEINDNYIDFSQNIIAPNGERITSAWLVKDKINVLIPEGYDTTKYSQLLCNRYRNEDIKIDDINYIEYDRSSRFFTFDNETCMEQNGYCNEVLLYVYDFEFNVEHFHPERVFRELYSYFTNSIYYKYNTDSKLTAFEQIQPAINQCGLEKVMISSPTVEKEFYGNLKKYEEQLIFEVVQFVIFAFAFVVMLVYTSELYYRNNAKNISVKLTHGYSFTGIFGNRMILKAAILPIMFMISENIGISPVVAIVCVCLELVIFGILMKLHSRKNVISVIKGE